MGLEQLLFWMMAAIVTVCLSGEVIALTTLADRETDPSSQTLLLSAVVGLYSFTALSIVAQAMQRGNKLAEELEPGDVEVVRSESEFPAGEFGFGGDGSV